MATVRLTKDLTNAIINKLADQFRIRSEAVNKAIAEGFTHMLSQYEEDLLAVVLEAHNMPRDVYDSIPDGWCHRTKTLKALYLNDVETIQTIPTARYDEIKIPAKLNYTHESLSLVHPKLQPYADYASQANAQLSELDREEHGALSEARKLLEQCGSLKQALDAWPHLMELLPDWAIKQHNEVSEKRKKAEPINIDTDRLTGAVVAGKIAVAILNRS